MKSFLVKLLRPLLRIHAGLVLKRYRPEIVAVTGSVGKTSTKDAIYEVLSTTYKTGRSEKNYNNELGVPLSIIGVETGGSSWVGWVFVFFKAWKLVIRYNHNYPKILVLEMGVDRPGDLDYLLNYVPVKVAVVTRVAPVHIEFFETLDRIAKEKAILVKRLPKSGLAVLNADDEEVIKMSKGTKAKVLTFGKNPKADIRAEDIKHIDGGEGGVSFKLNRDRETVSVIMPRVLGTHLVQAALSAAAVGHFFEVSDTDIAQALANFESAPGRMKLLEGVKGSRLIDDTYNGSPEATRAALESLADLEIGSQAARYAVLGDMLELGSWTESEHQQIGKLVAKLKIDYLFTVGEMSRDIGRGAIKAGLDEDRYFHFSDSREAGKFLQDRLRPGGLALIKGSQGIRMERCVKEVMAEPARASELLCRQTKAWR